MLDEIKVSIAELENEEHRKGVWMVKNDSLDSSRLTSEIIPYKDHCDWWRSNFDKEYIYIINYQARVIGYIRLTKEKTSSKDKYEISISLSEEFQAKGIGSYAYGIFEKYMKERNISQIIASTSIKNESGQKFFEKNGFLKENVKGDYIMYFKKL
jgi:RimJ/RimL family protein N-acetyltransferase